MTSVNKAIVLVLIGIVSVQGGASIAKHLFPLIGAESMTFLRIWFSALMLWIVYRPWRQKLSREALIAVVIYGAALGLMNLLFYQSLSRIPLGIAVAVEFIGPLSVAVYASRKALDFIWALLALVGIFLIYPRGADTQDLNVVGVVMALGAGVMWGCYIVFAQRLGRFIQGGTATALGMLVAALAVTPFSVAHVLAAPMSWQILLAAAGVGLLSSTLPYSLEMTALRTLPKKSFGVMMSLEPAVAALFGFVALHEQLSVKQWLAILCVIVASCGSSLMSRGSAAAPEA